MPAASLPCAPPGVIADHMEAETVKRQVIDRPATDLCEAAEGKAKPANGHPRKRAAKTGCARRHTQREEPSRKKAGSQFPKPPPPLALARPPVSRPLHAATEVTGVTEELAINGISLQVRTLSGPAARPDRLPPAESAAAREPSKAASGQEAIAADTSEGDPTTLPSVRSLPNSPEAGQSTAALPPFRPVLEVDRFLWPPDCEKLEHAAAAPLDSLAEQMAEQASVGRKVVAIASCRRGDGCTTLLLSLAPRLSALGLRVLLVDADFHNPLLARSLGLVPEHGWEEVLAGRLPAEEVIVESLHDRLALLPLCEPPPGRSYELGGDPDPAVSLKQLAAHYDVVLLDLGRFHRHDASGSSLPQPNAEWIDALVLIRNVRSTPEEDLARNRRRVRAVGVHELGIVENFV